MKKINLAIALMIQTSFAVSQNSILNDSSIQLNEVTVIYEANKNTPVTYQEIKAKAIDVKSTGQEPSFILTETPSVTNYSDGGNSQGYSYFRIRGWIVSN